VLPSGDVLVIAGLKPTAMKSLGIGKSLRIGIKSDAFRRGIKNLD
jgi:hypothetical protein